MSRKSDIKPEVFECIYRQYNKRKLVHPDPLEFLYDYPALEDREITAMVASSLAYGRVAQILKSVSTVLKTMGKSPYEYLRRVNIKQVKNEFRSFKHRFTTGDEITSLLSALKKMIEDYGSIGEFFSENKKKALNDVSPLLVAFVDELEKKGCSRKVSLISSPENGSACKRMNLFMRWMVRNDAVDPGGWNYIDPGKLIVPLDTHMHKICLKFGFTKRKQADLKAALEITDAFKKICTEDPVRYDFSLTRFGIRDDENYAALYKRCGLLKIR